MPDTREGGPRVALVIGNSAYQSVGFLENPKNDAAAMVAALEGLAFGEVISAIDLSQRELLAKLDEFYGKLDSNGTALLFYAGHGVQVRGHNYLLPCDAKVARAADLRTTAVALNDVVRAMSRRAGTRLLFLDACRNDPISDEAGGLARGARSAAIGRDMTDVGQGLAKITATAGTFVAYATEPGNVALDGTGANSPFTTALLSHIAEPGLAVDDIMMQVRVDVLDATQGKQLPWSESALTRRFQFKEGPPSSVGRDFEQEYWDRVKDTDNPDFLESFLRQFPNGRYAETARARVGRVRARKEAADWETARSTDTIAALADFARRYPGSPRTGAARARLFMRQFAHGSRTFGLAVLVILAICVPALAYLTRLVAELLPQYVANPAMAETDNAAMISFGMRLLAASAAVLLGPWIVFGGLLWATLTRFKGRPVRRTVLAFLIALVPVVILIVDISIDSWLRQSAKAEGELAQSSLKYMRTQQQVETHKKDAAAQGPAAAERLRQLEQDLAQALKEVQAVSWEWSFRQRHVPLVHAAIAGFGALLTLVLSAAAISGWRQLRLWGPSIRGGALVAALTVVVWSLYSHSVWNDTAVGALFGVWLAVCGFLALGVVRAAAAEEPLPTARAA
jgi:hypothetical protein